MTAYLIAVETIHDEVMSAEYRKQVVPTVEAFGGRLPAAYQACIRLVRRLLGTAPPIGSRRAVRSIRTNSSFRKRQSVIAESNSILIASSQDRLRGDRHRPRFSIREDFDADAYPAPPRLP